MRIGLLGNPENRRVGFFVEAAQRRGLAVQVFAWRDLLGDEAVLDALATCDVVRMESAGEEAAVSQALIARGGGPTAPIEHGRIAYLQAYHRGFLQTLEQLSALPVRWLIPPDSVAAMFDKWATHQRLSAAGVPRPQTRLAPASFEAWQASIADQPAGRRFLKPRYGSSASGVCAVRWSGSRSQLTAPVELVEDAEGVRLFNTLKVRTTEAPHARRAILGALLPQGMIEERWLPKATVDGRVVDLRIVVIAGEARQIVVRSSKSPMTNLHLGNARGDLDRFVEVLGQSALDGAKEQAVRAVACFPDALYAGVDVLVSPSGAPAVLEVNAFGDLLPGIQSRGQSTYEACVEALCAM